MVQASAAMDRNGIRHGIISPAYTPDLQANVQIASVMTMAARLKKHPFKYDLIIVDEAQHSGAKSWVNIRGHFSESRLLGVTATPCRQDGKGLGVEAGGMYDDLILGPTIMQLIAKGWLVQPMLYGAKKNIDFSGIDIKMGDYDAEQQERLLDKSGITGSAVGHYREVCDGVPCVVFCVSILHAEHVARQFCESGYAAEKIDGYMTRDEQKRIIKDFSERRIQVLVNVDLIGEGFDIPAIGCVIMLRKTKSLALFLQWTGRALRPCEGKEYAVILDHVGNYIDHGMPHWDREWTLDGKKKRSRKSDEKLLRTVQCPSCYRVHEPAPICPYCDFTYEVKKRDIKETDGKLELINGDAEVEEMLKRKKKQEVGMAGSLDALTAIEKARGYKKGWAKHVWDAKQKKTVNI